MDRYFAQINNGIVQRVIVAHTKEWCEQNLGGVWVEVPENKVGVGFSYDDKKKLFIEPKPKYKGVEIKNFTLDETTRKWKPPVEDPKDGRFWSIFTNEWLTKEEIDVQIMKDKKK